MQAFEQSYDIRTEAQVVLEGGCRRQLLWHVAAERHDVANAQAVVGLGNGRDFLPGVVYRGQMRHDGEPEILAEHRGHLGRALAGGSAGAVGDRHEIRFDPLQGGGGPAQRLDSGVVFWREEFQRSQGASLREEVRD